MGGKYYIRLESHELDGTTYTIRNKAYYSDASGTVGAEAPLNAVPEWADIQPEITIQDMSGPLFAYFRPPGGQHNGRKQPLRCPSTETRLLCS